MKKDDKSSLQVWDSSNLAESFPGIVTPLTFSIARRGYELVYKSQGYEAGLDWYQLEANHRAFNSMVGIFAGRMYYNLKNWYMFIGLFPNNKRNQEYLDEQIQTVGEAVYRPAQQYPFRYRLKFWSKVIRRALFFERERKRYWTYLDEAFAEYENLEKDNKIFRHFERYAFLEQQVVPHMGRGVDNDFFVMTYNGILKNRLRHWLGDFTAAQHDFLGALHDVISAQQALLLLDIARVIKADHKASTLLHQSKFEQLNTYLSGTPAQKPLTEYRAKFLHRFAEDQKIEAINPLLELEGFYSLIRAYTELDEKDVVTRRESASKHEQERTQAIVKQLALVQKLLYKILLNRLKHHLRIREHNRLLRGKVYALLRELFIELGDELTKQGILNNPRDIYYLDIDELFQVVDSTGYEDDFKSLVGSRKLRYEGYRKLKAPTRFVTTGVITRLPADFKAIEDAGPTEKSRILKGLTASPGKAEGKVIVLDEPVMPSEPYDILVVNHTDPGWTPLIALAKGLVVEHGGILSHAAIVTRELGIPSIIGVQDATQHLENGMYVRINSATSSVEVVSDEQ